MPLISFLITGFQGSWGGEITASESKLEQGLQKMSRMRLCAECCFDLTTGNLEHEHGTAMRGGNQSRGWFQLTDFTMLYDGGTGWGVGCSSKGNTCPFVRENDHDSAGVWPPVCRLSL